MIESSENVYNIYKMTIAQLYQHLNITSFSRLCTAEKITLIQHNTIVQVRSRMEAGEYAFCINHVPNRILAQATHCWALELSYAGRVPEGHPAADYIASQLLNGYRRTARKDMIKIALQMLPHHFDRFRDTPLHLTITQLYTWLMNEQQMRNMTREVEQATDMIRATVAASAREETERQERIRQQREAIEEEIQVARARLLGDYTVQEPRRGTERHEREQETNETAHARLQSIYTDDQTVIARAIELSLRVSASSQEKEKIPLKDVVAFCRANKLFRYRTYNPISQKWTHTIVDPVKAKRIQALLEEEATSEQGACNVCMTADGTFSCGDSSCAFRMCSNCFFSWFLKNPKCPGCRREYIPIATRSQAATTAPARVGETNPRDWHESARAAVVAEETDDD